ncbi:MAG: DUF4381 domain-containing protein [Nitrospira sp.]|nr:DUF4381 domain-containing protein [Candidatus Manganitrophaceae bacterium]HIL34525.1 DUF4381 domain-containing protein [Candidatus Manganitrophaceae bacterium]
MGEGSALQLRDIHLPDPVSWWPPAPGWWGLITLALLFFLALRAFLKMKKARRVRVAALKELELLSTTFTQAQDAHHLVKALSVLLRRICLSYYPRFDVAGLTGEAWLHFLDQHFEEEKGHGRFSKSLGRSLITAPYQAKAEIDGLGLLNLCKDWITALPPLGSLPRGGSR